MKNCNISNVVASLTKHLQNIPVQLWYIAQEYNIKIEHKPLGDISGQIIKNHADDGFVISVNANHSINRQRFTTAHELGHFFLHRMYIGDGLVDDPLYRSTLSNQQETEANVFAGEILMPEEAIRKEWKAYIKRHHLHPPLSKNYRRDGEEISNFIATMMNTFIVSEYAMRVRTGLTFV